MIHVVREAEYQRLRRCEIEAFGDRKRFELMQAVNDQLRERIRELEALLISMKRDGFEAPAPPTEDTTPQIPSVVLEAIDEVTTPGTPLRQHELELAMQEIQEGKDPAEVAEAILKGGDYHPWR